MDVSDLGRSVTGRSLRRKDPLYDPVRQFEHWFREACESDRPDPNAMSLATVDAEQRPACRTVLLKYFDSRGFVFFTNLSSNKSQQIQGNSNVALLFFWPDLGRQVCVRGTAGCTIASCIRVAAPKTGALKGWHRRIHGSRITARLQYIDKLAK